MEELKRADLHLTGKVGGTSPIEITGKINPLNQNAATQLKIALNRNGACRTPAILCLAHVVKLEPV